MSDLIVGADEVGRGCLAGPLVIAAVAWPCQSANWLSDSKQLSPNQRNLAFWRICRGATATAVCFQSPEAIDNRGLGSLLREGFNRTVSEVLSSLDNDPVRIIVDGSINYLDEISDAEAIVKADTKIEAVMAAGVLAKVVRDQFMIKVASKQHPNHKFSNHKGYGTKEHIAAIKKFGAIQGLHRFSFRPIRS